MGGNANFCLNLTKKSTLRVCSERIYLSKCQTKKITSMKKILLLAVVALTATAMSAQTVAKKANSPAMRHQSQSVEPSLTFSEQPVCEPLEEPSYGVVAIGQNENPERALTQQLQLSEGETVTPVVTRNTSRSMIKESSLYSSYTGSGTNYSSSAAVSWTMTFGTGTDSDGNTVDIVTDVIPVPSSWSSISEISVEYTLSDGVLTIEPQLVVTTTSYYVYIFSTSTEDYSIVMTVDEDGAITTTDGDYYYYGAFTTEEFDTTFDTYAGYYEIITSPKYYYEGQDTEPTASMSPDCMYLFASFSYDGYYYGSSYNYGMIPAYSEISFDNYSSDASSYEWSTPKLTYDSDEGAYVTSSTQTGEDEDFTFETESGVYGATSLTATSIGGGYTDTYNWGQGVYVYSSGSHRAFAGYAGDNFAITSTGSVLHIGLPNYDFAYASYGKLGTPDINTSNYSISDLILYQGKPSGPLYIEGINYMGKATSFADDGIELTCIIRKATQASNGYSLTLGDTIAISDSPSYQLGSSNVSLEFTDFYKYDEDGMTVGVDHLFIEDEFVVQFSGYDNGTFSFLPYGEYSGYYPSTGKLTTYMMLTDDTSFYRWSMYSHQYVGFLGAVYGYLYTEDSKDITFDGDGGTATLTINPYYCNVDDDGNYETLLYLEDDSEIPDWLEVSYDNENYSTSPWSFDLVLTAEAITDDTEERSGSFRLYQPGAFLDITVTQSASGGISATVVDSAKPVVTVDGDNIIISEDVAAEVYSVAGMKVAQGESTIDASALSSGVYIVKLADGTAVKVIK